MNFYNKLRIKDLQALNVRENKENKMKCFYLIYKNSEKIFQ